MTDTKRPTVGVELIERVDETLRDETGVPVDELGFGDKVEALLAGYGPQSDGEPTVHPEVAERIQRLERAVANLSEAIEQMQTGAAQPAAAPPRQGEQPRAPRTDTNGTTTASDADEDDDLLEDFETTDVFSDPGRQDLPRR